jgi:hypothetical protein
MQCFCENRYPVSLTRRKIAGNWRLKGASWSKFDEFAEEFEAITAAEVAEKLHQRSDAQPLKFDAIPLTVLYWGREVICLFSEAFSRAVAAWHTAATHPSHL